MMRWIIEMPEDLTNAIAKMLIVLSWVASIGYYDWCLTNAYDYDDQTQTLVIHRIPEWVHFWTMLSAGAFVGPVVAGILARIAVFLYGRYFVKGDIDL